MDLRIIADSLERIEGKVDTVVEKLGTLSTDHAVLNERFNAHDALETKTREEKQAVKTGLTWPLIVVMVGAIASAWVPTVFALGRTPQTQTSPAVAGPQK